jgi:hypothetical protein
VLLVAGFHDKIVLLSNEFLHLLKGSAHLRCTSDQSDKHFGVSGIALRVTNGELEVCVSNFRTMK